MGNKQRLWLVDNASSGSNDQDALDALHDSCGVAGFQVVQRTDFPSYELPSPAVLDAAEVGVVAVFAGDGTINATINHLAGWSGAVLVLAGGTMNLLYHRLHGQRDMHEVVCAAAAGKSRRIRAPIVKSGEWRGLAGVMAGPGTSWNGVREAMRDNSIVEMAGNTVQAIEQTLGGAMIVCVDPPLGRRSGYPLVLLHPAEQGIEVVGYHADTMRQYLEQSVALLKRDFREGPHDDLGTVERVVLTSTDGRKFGLLVDGEPEQGEEVRVAFELARSEVDLLATEPGPEAAPSTDG